MLPYIVDALTKSGFNPDLTFSGQVPSSEEEPQPEASKTLGPAAPIVGAVAGGALFGPPGLLTGFILGLFASNTNVSRRPPRSLHNGPPLPH